MEHGLKLKSRLAERLAEQGRSKAWLARQLGTGPSYIARVAQGKVIPKVSTAMMMACALNCDIEDLWMPVV